MPFHIHHSRIWSIALASSTLPLSKVWSLTLLDEEDDPAGQLGARHSAASTQRPHPGSFSRAIPELRGGQAWQGG
jgi:hypothetical protein